MKQDINVTESQNVTVIQVGGDFYLAKGLLPKEVESQLQDGDERNFCFLSIDVVGHSDFSSKFSSADINDTLMKLREWFNSIISKKEGKELNWAGDGGIFYFLQEKANDKAVDSAISASMDILDGLAEFNKNNSHNKLDLQGSRTDIRLRSGIDFGNAIHRTDPGNWHSEALNTASKIQHIAQPNSVLITNNVYKNLKDSLRTNFKEVVGFKGHPSYVFSRERIIDTVYKKYFDQISRIRKEEFEHLGNWVDLDAVETKLTSHQEYDRGKTLSALNLINECVEAARNALIFGESGAGKTFTCLKLFEDLKEEYCRSDTAINERIPLFVELSRVKNKNNDLDKLIREGISEDQFNNDKDKYLIFLDGLNEVGDLEDQKGIFSEIRRFCVLNQETRVFVTTQTISEYHQGSEFELYEIQPFGKEDVIEYLCKFEDKFTSRLEAESFYDDLPDLIKGFISIPVFLYLVVSTYEKGMQARIISPGQLIGQYEEFLCGPRESRPIDLDEDYRKGVIPFIAFNMCQNNEINLGLRDFNEYVHQYNRDNSSSINEIELKKIVTNEFMLMKADGERHDLRFIFQALRDYFAAVYMKSEAFNPDKISELVYKDSVMNGDIVSAVRLLAGIVGPEAAKGIIQVFIEKDPYLACEIYAWSSIAIYEAGFIDVIRDKIDIHSREYLLNLNVVVAFYLKVLDLIKKAEGLGTRISTPSYADCYMNLGNAYSDKLDHDMAIEAYKKAIGIYEENNMQTHPSYAQCHMNLGVAYWGKLDHDMAIEAYKKAIGIYEENGMQTHPSYARCHGNLGEAYRGKGKSDEAIQALVRALSIFEQSVGVGKDHPHYKHYLKILEDVRSG